MNVAVFGLGYVGAVTSACLAQRGILSYTAFVALKIRSPASYRRRWQNWPGVLAALRLWCATHDPDFQHLADLPGPEGPGSVLPAVNGRGYGAPLNYPGFLHEPVNEQGVVLLFGALARDLGFAVEHVSGSVPDCEAKRRRGDIWERTRIEFEFLSRNFKSHGHDALQCDLIVCWEDNWAEAPIEVLALKTELARIRASP